MKLEEIQGLWSIDSKIDPSNLTHESLKIPELHHKYYKIYITEKLKLRQEELDYKEFHRLKHEYYSGKLAKNELDMYGWRPFQHLILKTELPLYIEADKEIASRLIKIQLQKEKVIFVENIIKNLNNRGFWIKNAIDFLKFSNGGH